MSSPDETPATLHAQIDTLRRQNKLLKQGLDQAERILHLWDNAVRELQATKVALQESREFLDQVLTAAPQPLAVMDGRGCITMVNAATERLLCRSRESLLGKRAIGFLAPDARKRALASVRSAPSAGSEEFEVLASDGPRTVIVAWAMLRRIGGKSIHVILAGEDITERKRAQEALRESEQRFRALFEQAGVGVAQVDTKSGRYVRINRRYCEILGHSAEETQRMTFYDVIHPDDLQATLDQMASLVAGKIGEFSVEKRYRRKDGTIVWADVTVSPLWAPGEEPTFHVAVAQDITERVRAQEANVSLELRIQAEVAKSRQKDHLLIQQSRLAAMGEMAHNIAHQWRQPLNALGIIITNIRDDYIYHELDEYGLYEAVEKSQKLLEGMSKTIDDLRSFFQPDREACSFDLSQAVDSAIVIIREALTNHHIALVKVLERDLTAFGYPNQFAQAVLNVLANAKEAIQECHPAEAWIHVTLAHSDGHAILSIEDNAGGIAEAIMPRIFEPYFTTKEQGSGIGLYMAKTIIERNMRGTIDAANGPLGAIFTVTIPLQETAPIGGAGD
ncbi:MAG: domain S-box [Proteobacteria bacterium]|nr:domain S-box [Pseudomonadota bacterium]